MIPLKALQLPKQEEQDWEQESHSCRDAGLVPYSVSLLRFGFLQRTTGKLTDGNFQNVTVPVLSLYLLQLLKEMKLHPFIISTSARLNTFLNFNLTMNHKDVI